MNLMKNYKHLFLWLTFLLGLLYNRLYKDW